MDMALDRTFAGLVHSYLDCTPILYLYAEHTELLSYEKPGPWMENTTDFGRPSNRLAVVYDN